MLIPVTSALVEVPEETGTAHLPQVKPYQILHISVLREYLEKEVPLTLRPLLHLFHAIVVLTIRSY